jgi:DNA-binding transcriptional ArsR family regulator
MGSAVPFTLLLSSPFLWGAGIRHWLLGLAVGVALGRVLRDAGLVGVRADAQRRLYALRPQPLAEVDRWLRPYRALWSERLDALERHLDQSAEEPHDRRAPHGRRDRREGA